MKMIDTIMVIVPVLMCLVAFYMMIRNMESIPTKTKIYMIIYTLLVIGIAVTFRICYSKNPLNTVPHDLKRFAIISILGPIACVDFKEMKIPNKFLILGLSYWLIITVLELIMEPNYWKGNLISELVAAGILLLASGLCMIIIKNSIGAGDVKLFFVMGMLLGLEAAWEAVFLSLIISFVVVIVLLVSKKKGRTDMIPFGPAITVGTVLSIWLTGL